MNCLELWETYALSYVMRIFFGTDFDNTLQGLINDFKSRPSSFCDVVKIRSFNYLPREDGCYVVNFLLLEGSITLTLKKTFSHGKDGKEIWGLKGIKAILPIPKNKNWGSVYNKQIRDELIHISSFEFDDGRVIT